MIKKYHDTAKASKAIVRHQIRTSQMRTIISLTVYPDHPGNRYGICSVRPARMVHGEIIQRKPFGRHKGGYWQHSRVEVGLFFKFGI